MDPREALYQDEWFRSRIQTIEKALLALLDDDQSEEAQSRRAELFASFVFLLG
jgi:hypothetical protein